MTTSPPVFVDMSFVLTCCMVCMSLYYVKLPKTYLKGCVLTILGVIISYIVVTIWQFMEVTDTRLYVIFIAPTLLGVVVGVGIVFKFKPAQFPIFISFLTLISSLSSFTIVTSEFLKPTYFFLNENERRDTLDLLFIEICIGMAFSVFCFVGHIALLLRLVHIFPDTKLRVPLRGFFVISSLVLTVLFSTFIIFIRDNLVKMIFYFVSVGLVGISAFMVTMVDHSDLSIMTGLLESMSGWSVVVVGFLRQNEVVVFCGSIIGMYCITTAFDSCSTKQVSLLSLFFSNTKSTNDFDGVKKTVEVPQITLKEVGRMCLENQNIVIVPSYISTRTQNQIYFSDFLALMKEKEKNVRIAIHPNVEVLRGFLEIVMILGKVKSEDLCSFEINERMKDIDLAIILGDCRMTPYSSALWKKFEVDKALHTVVISDKQLIENKEENVLWCQTTIGSGLESLVDFLRHAIY
ncbi:NADP transhydrogenase subunit beta, putative [Entamoeba invadens IP1]|uniref:proton-translocating NAD(P)(+) transhydrogenase n=1 Tax=Entamoeba invadens IP1 TaxID=370355 RepID=A0A0A1U7Q5_ENTIV|nr:NADP transhydrogenase subunit beta, putative [Entamoeba invadens IP1]ELP90882.1 NADP transhydrogenase subunit beta, putative [Entamoeba invadens IP1]|eukprot:XP_004257653.1 NADP transhydrogenase subunit beta, putative [Entamoeba invadens IP1]